MRIGWVCPECGLIDGDCTCLPASQREDADNHPDACDKCGEEVCDGYCDEIEF